MFLQRLFRRITGRPVEERGLSEILLAGLESIAEGEFSARLASSAAETAATVWGNALASARVSGDVAARVLTPDVLHHSGRSLIREGEAVWLIERPASGDPYLRHCDATEVLDGWRYRVQVGSPPGRTMQRTVSRNRIVHFRWSVDPLTPWQGVGPFTRASLGSALAAAVENGLRREAGGPVALLLPVPVGSTDLNELAADISKAKGAAVMAESTAAGWDEGRASGTQGDWHQRRVGPDPPEQLLALRRDAYDTVLAAAGVPPSLGNPRTADGTRLREDYRRFVLANVEPVARRMLAELRAKLMAPALRLDFSNLWAHDLQGRSSAVDKLVRAGVSLPEALRMTGMAP